MLTRLKVSGFKNLVGVDVHFGPFTCIAGANGVGKSNLFDAIRFLSALADKPLIEAAASVRDDGGRTTDVRSIFHRAGDRHDGRIELEAEMIVPTTGMDDLGQEAEASITFLRYKLAIEYRDRANHRALGSLELMEEELSPIKISDAPKNLLFPHNVREWRRKAVVGRRSGGSFISTQNDGTGRSIRLHQDGGSSGRPLSRAAQALPRTVLSAANAAESPTTLLARREMQSWRLLQLEPSALREPDSFTAPTKMGANGSHLAATLYHLANSDEGQVPPEIWISGPEAAYANVANRLSELIADVRSVSVDRDEKRELLTITVNDEHGTPHTARSLSDGTLRFLALAVVEADPQMEGVLCLEEPENGIHPERIPAMLSLLKDICTDPEDPYDAHAPLRQVIINTHSPAVVMEVPEDSLLVAESRETLRDGVRSRCVMFSALENTWRTTNKHTRAPITSLGKILTYLNPIERDPGVYKAHTSERPRRKRQRVIDREDVAPYLPWSNDVHRR